VAVCHHALYLGYTLFLGVVDWQLIDEVADVQLGRVRWLSLVPKRFA
jgi:hypothetical protein